MRGIYLSYNEEENGCFGEAIEMSRNSYVIWKNKISCKKNLRLPAEIIIRIKGKEKYYKGDLLLVRPYGDFNSKIFKDDIYHRPETWRMDTGESKEVFFIANLKKQINKPKEIETKSPPQGLTYF